MPFCRIHRQRGRSMFDNLARARILTPLRAGEHPGAHPDRPRADRQPKQRLRRAAPRGHFRTIGNAKSRGLTEAPRIMREIPREMQPALFRPFSAQRRCARDWSQGDALGWIVSRLWRERRKRAARAAGRRPAAEHPLGPVPAAVRFIARRGRATFQPRATPWVFRGRREPPTQPRTTKP